MALPLIPKQPNIPIINKQIDISDIKPCKCKVCNSRGFVKGYSIRPVPASRHPLLKDELITVAQDVCAVCGALHGKEDFMQYFNKDGGGD